MNSGQWKVKKDIKRPQKSRVLIKREIEKTGRQIYREFILLKVNGVSDDKDV